jgi:metal-responsive CopG/Arc/MetJ family transcriptional regulator
MEKILVSLPNDLVKRMKTVIPARKRSQVVKDLLEQEIDRREEALFQCALAVEKDKALNKEMAEWDVTIGDGIEPEAW